MKIGVISDTHGYLDPRVAGLLEGVEHILHAGDIGTPRVVVELEQIAPVTAVCGNVDGGLHYRDTEVIELEGRKFLVHHNVSLQAMDEALQRRLEREKPDVVVFGHTHKPFAETLAGRLYVNPGYTGKSRFGLPRSLAILHCEKEGIRTEFRFLGES